MTKPFEYPIPRYDLAITLLGIGSGKLWIITEDARQGYHQIRVRECDINELGFFAPND